MTISCGVCSLSKSCSSLHFSGMCWECLGPRVIRTFSPWRLCSRRHVGVRPLSGAGRFLPGGVQPLRSGGEAAGVPEALRGASRETARPPSLVPLRHPAEAPPPVCPRDGPRGAGRPAPGSRTPSRPVAHPPDGAPPQTCQDPGDGRRVRSWLALATGLEKVVKRLGNP